VKKPTVSIFLVASVVLGVVAAALIVGNAGGTSSDNPRASVLAADSQSAENCGIVRGPDNPDGTTVCAAPRADTGGTPTGLPGIPVGDLADQSKLPDCIPVNAGPTTVGCTLKADTFPDPETYARVKQQYPLGVPVYDLDTHTTIVGYMTLVGFVPNSLVSRFDEVRTCEQALSAEMQGTSSTKLSADCQAVLAEQGVDPAVLADK